MEDMLKEGYCDGMRFGALFYFCIVLEYNLYFFLGCQLGLSSDI